MVPGLYQALQYACSAVKAVKAANLLLSTQGQPGSPHRST